jgi:hypothetical protein
MTAIRTDSSTDSVHQHTVLLWIILANASKADGHLLSCRTIKVEHVRPVNEIGETGGRSIGCEEMSDAASILAA